MGSHLSWELHTCFPELSCQSRGGGLTSKSGTASGAHSETHYFVSPMSRANRLRAPWASFSWLNTSSAPASRNSSTLAFRPWGKLARADGRAAAEGCLPDDASPVLLRRRQQPAGVVLRGPRRGMSSLRSTEAILAGCGASPAARAVGADGSRLNTRRDGPPLVWHARP
jgi:hypothetical protein